MSDASKYRHAEIQDVLDAGPADDETWFRLQVQGKHKSKHLNVSRDQLVAIQGILAGDIVVEEVEHVGVPSVIVQPPTRPTVCNCGTPRRNAFVRDVCDRCRRPIPHS